MSDVLTEQKLEKDQIKEALQLLTGIKSSYGTMSEDLKKYGAVTSETRERLDKLDKGLTELHSTIEEKSSKKIEALEAEVKSLKEQNPLHGLKTMGEAIVNVESFIEYMKSGNNGGYAKRIEGVNIWKAHQLKNITGTGLLYPQNLPGIQVGPQIPLGVRSVVPQGRTTAGAIQYIREASFTNAAATVAEGALKPQSEKTLEPKTGVVTTIAHFFKVSRQSYDDTPGLASLIDQNGIYGVQVAEDDQLLNGNGVSPNIDGFNHIATTAPVAPDVPEGATYQNTLIDAVGASIFDLAAKGYLASGVVVNQADWGKVAMLKNSLGNYLFANPIEYNPIQRIWGTRMVMAGKQPAGTYLTGAFQGNSLLLDREEVGIQIATQNQDDFIKNTLTILIEERLILLVFAAAAFQKGVVPTA